MILLLLISQQMRREFYASLHHMFISCIVKFLHDPNKIPTSLAKSCIVTSGYINKVPECHHLLICNAHGCPEHSESSMISLYF